MIAFTQKSSPFGEFFLQYSLDVGVFFLIFVSSNIKKDDMRQTRLWMIAVILVVCGVNGQAQTKRSDDFRAKYELKEVVVMSRPLPRR